MGWWNARKSNSQLIDVVLYRRFGDFCPFQFNVAGQFWLDFIRKLLNKAAAPSGTRQIIDKARWFTANFVKMELNEILSNVVELAY
mgnify:CR=1 FL=1